MIANAAPSVKSVERRRHARAKIAIIGRYMLANRQEFPCQTINVSAGGLALSAPTSGAIGERVIAYFDQLGRIEGVIVRHLENGFVITANIPAAKKEKLVNQLTWLVNRATLGLPEDRRHERIVPKVVATTIRFADGQTVAAKIIDVSVSGAAVNCEAVAAAGAILQIGATTARVVRAFQNGLALEFVRPLSFDVFDENIKL